MPDAEPSTAPDAPILGSNTRNVTNLPTFMKTRSRSQTKRPIFAERDEHILICGNKVKLPTSAQSTCSIDDIQVDSVHGLNEHLTMIITRHMSCQRHPVHVMSSLSRLLASHSRISSGHRSIDDAPRYSPGTLHRYRVVPLIAGPPMTWPAVQGRLATYACPLRVPLASSSAQTGRRRSGALPDLE